MSALRQLVFVLGIALLASYALSGLALGAKPSRGVTVTNLGAVVGYSWSRASAINDQGQVVGISGKDRNAGSPYRAVRWTRTGGSWKISQLATPVGSNSAASDIDSSGNISGDIGDGIENRGTVWTGTGVTTLPTDPGCLSSALGINDRHEVVGNHCGHAVVWIETAGVWQRHALPDAPGLLGVGASDINESEMIAGSALTSTGGRHGVIWKKAGNEWQMYDLQFGTDWTLAHDVNDSGQVTGYFEQPCCPPNGSAFVWTEASGGAPLASFGINRTLPFAISNYGQIVGSAGTSTGLHAFLWTDTAGMRDLTPSLDYTFATGINTTGQVVGEGIFGGRHLAALFTLPCPAWGTPSCP